MTSVVVDHPREATKTIVKATIEQMPSIDAYTDEGQRIVGKQKASITGGNGARLVVNIPEMQEHDNRTHIEVTAEKEVQLDQVTNPEDIKSEFLNIINDLREKNIDQILDEMSDLVSHKSTKEVDSSTELGSNESAMGARFVITFIIMMIFTLGFGAMMTSMMMP